MFHLLIVSHIIQLFLAFIVLDRIKLNSLRMLFLSSVLLLLVCMIPLRVHAVSMDYFILFTLLIGLSFMYHRQQTIRHSLLNFSLAYLLIFAIDIPRPLFTAVVVSDNQWLMLGLFSVHVLLTTGLAWLIQKYILPRLNSRWKSFVGSALLLLFLGDRFANLYFYVRDYPEAFKLNMLIQVLVVLVILGFTLGIASLLSLAQNQKLALETQKKKIEYEALQLYTNELAKQQHEIRKFRHDYINILTSMETYIAADDLPALKTYYHEHIQPTRSLFAKNFSRLDDLQKIEDNAIRSIFTTKLLLAQEKGLDVQLEINETIQLPAAIDPILLIRIIGILLDNAIEELETLSAGKLAVVLFKVHADTLLIIQNTARATIEPLHQLRKPGFSTKGSERGLGLSTVDELIAQIPELLLETTSTHQQFAQKLTILGG